jgi:hypothetical protein
MTTMQNERGRTTPAFVRPHTRFVIASVVAALGCSGPANAQADAIEAIALRWSGLQGTGSTCNAVDPQKRSDGVTEVCLYRALVARNQSDTV